jgi:uncharacterized protein (DUF2267 family)
MTGIQTLDTAVGATEEWINALMARLGWQGKERTYLALLAALHALRDALPRDEADYLGVQLPVLLRGLYFEGWHPASHIQRAKSRSAFVERIQEGGTGIRASMPKGSPMPCLPYLPSACRLERSSTRRQRRRRRCGCSGRRDT